MQSTSRLAPLSVINILVTVCFSVWSQCSVAGQPASIPMWLKEHVGQGDGQIAEVVLQRARALYQRKLAEGAIKNPCYFAMDATRPNDLGGGEAGRRFYVICESKRAFRAVRPATVVVDIWEAYLTSRTEGHVRRTSATRWIQS